MKSHIIRQSALFTKTRREAPSDEVAQNAKLLIRAGFVHKQMAGVYAYLPLGLRTLNNVCDIIRREMDALGANELELTALQPRDIWQTSGRWSDAVVDNWFKTKLKNDTELGLGFTHEEPLTVIMRDYVSSYRDLPCLVYQIQLKFRNEARAKSGIMRGREFLMKDLYSFATNAAEHEKLYEAVKQAYIRIFNAVGIGDRTYVTYATGGSFSKYSHEFQMVTDAGEDTIYIHEGKHVAINKEILDDEAAAKEVLAELGCKREDLIERKAVEVGNIFSLGTRFSDALGLQFKNEAGIMQPVIMGSYGIGPGRLMGAIVETLADEKGMVWPVAVAPFHVHLIALLNDTDGNNPKQSKVAAAAETLADELAARGVSVLYDDRVGPRPGEKFADADLMGMPLRIVLSEKTLAHNGSAHVELKARAGNHEAEFIALSDAAAVAEAHIKKGK